MIVRSRVYYLWHGGYFFFAGEKNSVTDIKIEDMSKNKVYSIIT